MNVFPNLDDLKLAFPLAHRTYKLEWEGLVVKTRPQLSAAFLSDAELLVDLTPFSVISADALVVVLAMLRHRALQFPDRTGVQVPDDPDALEYLGGLRFFKLVHELGVPILNIHPEWLSYEAPKRRRPELALASLQAVTASNLGTLADGINRMLEHEMERREVVIPAGSDRQVELYEFRNLLFELVHNAVRHAPSQPRLAPDQVVGYTCYRPWPKSWSKARFVCSDCGSGFRSTLSNQGLKTSDDISAIFSALLFRYFRHEAKIVSLFDALAFLRNLSGCLWVANNSAGATISLREAYEKNRFDKVLEEPTPARLRAIGRPVSPAPMIPGVHYCVDLSLPNRVDY